MNASLKSVPPRFCDKAGILDICQQPLEVPFAKQHPSKEAPGYWCRSKSIARGAILIARGGHFCMYL